MLLPEFQLSRSSGSALKVPGGVAQGGYMVRARRVYGSRKAGIWWETPITIITLHSV